MNPATTNLIVGTGAAVVGAVVGTIVAKKVLEKKPNLANTVSYVGGVMTGAGLVLLVKNVITTKSEAGAILAAG